MDTTPDPFRTTPTATEQPAAPEPRRRWTSRRVGALIATGVLAIGLLGLAGAAYAERQTGPTTADTTRTVPAYGWGSGPSTEGYGSGYGRGPGTGSTGPFGAQQGTSGSTATDTTDATAAQSVGIVQISSELSNGESAGTGMVLTSDGEVVTNHHVVAGATDIEVTVVSTGETYDATYVGSDSTTDVAVLQLDDASGLSTVDLDEGGTSVGAAVTSVGDAGGDGGSLTAAPGTVSAQDQDITVASEDGSGGGNRLTGLIQVDADIVPGDSGGALLDADGDVVGMNVAASSGSADITGYAIPLDTVLGVVDQIDSGQETSQVAIGYDGFLGVGLADTDAPVVATVEDDSPAADAGIEPGDTITTVDGTSVGSADALSSAVRGYDAGDDVTVGWTTSSGQAQTATVTLAQAPIA